MSAVMNAGRYKSGEVCAVGALDDEEPQAVVEDQVWFREDEGEVEGYALVRFDQVVAVDTERKEEECMTAQDFRRMILDLATQTLTLLMPAILNPQPKAGPDQTAELVLVTFPFASKVQFLTVMEKVMPIILSLENVLTKPDNAPRFYPYSWRVELYCQAGMAKRVAETVKKILDSNDPDSGAYIDAFIAASEPESADDQASASADSPVPSAASTDTHSADTSA